MEESEAAVTSGPAIDHSAGNDDPPDADESSVRRSTLRRLAAGARYYLGGIYRLFDDKQVLLCSQAVAFKVLITWVPIAILATGFIGRVLSRDRPYQIIQDFVTSYFPDYQADRLIEFVDQLQRVSVTLTIVGALGLLWAAVTLFSTLRTVLAIVFQEDWHQHRSKIAGLLFDARMVVQVGVLFMLTVILTTTTHSLDTIGLSFLSRFGIRPDWLESGWIELVRYLSWFAPLVLSIGMFYQLYYFVPIPRPTKKSVLAGSLVAAALWELGKSIFTRYATGVGRVDVWLPEINNDRIFEIGDAFGIIVGFVMWAYYSGFVLMLGGLIALLFERRHRRRTADREAASAESA